MGEAKRRALGREAAAAPPAPAPADDWNATYRPPIVPGKSCGSCTLCCKVMGIPEIKKRAWEQCSHVGDGVGCKIYSERPMSCRQFICGWLLDPNMGPDLKPEVCHVVTYQRVGQHIVATCDADYPGAWRAPNVLEFLQRLARVNAPKYKVILMEKGQTWYVNEQGVVPVDRG